MIVSLTQVDQETPIDLFELKQHLMIEDDSSDMYLHSLILASTAYAESITKRKLSAHLIELKYECIKEKYFIFGNFSDVQVYVNNTLLDKVKYSVNDECIKFTNPTSCIVRATCGYTPKTCPADLKQAILMIAATMFEQRLDVTFGIQSYKAHLSSEVLLKRHQL